MFLLDRKHGKIISGGLNIYPREVEEVLAKHPAIAETCVFGVSDSQMGRIRNRRSGLAERIMQGHGGGDHKVLQREDRLLQNPQEGASVLDSLPKNAYGKILQRELKNRFDKRSANDEIQ